jgi:hypothetical protein
MQKDDANDAVRHLEALLSGAGVETVFSVSGKSIRFRGDRASEDRGEIREVVTIRVRVGLFLRFEFHQFPPGFACMCVKLRLRMRGAKWNGQLSRRSFLSD